MSKKRMRGIQVFTSCFPLPYIADIVLYSMRASDPPTNCAKRPHYETKTTLPDRSQAIARSAAAASQQVWTCISVDVATSSTRAHLVDHELTRIHFTGLV